MIRMNKFLEKAYGVSSVNKLKTVLISHSELLEAFDFIELDLSEDISEFLDTFIEALSSSKNLTSLCIIDKNLIFDVSTVFSHLSLNQLRQFSLVTHDDTFLNEQKQKNFSRFVSSLPDLQSLELIFNRTEFSSTRLTELAISIGELQQLQELRLAIKSCQKVNDDFLSELCLSIKKQKELRKLMLDFSQCSITNVGLISLGETLINIPEMYQIQIICPRNMGISAVGSKSYFENLLKHKNCANFETTLIHQLELPQQSNPNFANIQYFNNEKNKLKINTPKSQFSTSAKFSRFPSCSIHFNEHPVKSHFQHQQPLYSYHLIQQYQLKQIMKFLKWV